MQAEHGVEKALFIIPETDYSDIMEQTVLPELAAARSTFCLTVPDGHSIYGECYRRADSLRGTILISHGFTEGCEKFREMIWYYLRAGWAVCIPEHRDHGRSRDGGEPAVNATYVDRFQNYVDDLDAVVREVLTKELPGPYCLYAHSMGGLIGTMYLEQHPGVFGRAVLSAPMFEINRGGLPLFAARLAAELLCLLGKGRDYLPGQGGFSDREDFAHSAATSRERYRFYYRTQMENPCLQSAGASCRWAREGFRAAGKALKNAGSVNIPVLLFRAEKDDYVLPGGQDKFLRAIPNGQLVFVPGSKHEIYLSENAILRDYLKEILNFLGT